MFCPPLPSPPLPFPHFLSLTHPQFPTFFTIILIYESSLILYSHQHNSMDFYYAKRCYILDTHSRIYTHYCVGGSSSCVGGGSGLNDGSGGGMVLLPNTTTTTTPTSNHHFAASPNSSASKRRRQHRRVTRNESRYHSGKLPALVGANEINKLPH